MVSALAAVGVGHGVAGLVNPVASPIIAVGSTLIDAAPTPAKEFAVRTFGTADKPILISSIGVVLLVFAAVLGSDRLASPAGRPGRHLPARHRRDGRRASPAAG